MLAVTKCGRRASSDMSTQQMAGLTWILCRTPVSAAVLNDHEQMLGVKFPQDFRQVIQKCPGGQPLERSDFWIEHPAHGRLGSGLGALVNLDSMDDGDSLQFCAYALHHYHKLPRHIIPIAMDGGGDYMCFDYSKSATHPRVVYYSHEAPREVAFCHLADSFTGFLDMLEPPEEEDSDDINGE